MSTWPNAGEADPRPAPGEPYRRVDAGRAAAPRRARGRARRAAPAAARGVPMTSTEATASRSGRRLDPDARRAEILEAALRLYAERPYAEVSTSELAREAGVARGLLNHYFGTKRELYLEALRTLLTIPEAAADRASRAHPGRTRGGRRRLVPRHRPDAPGPVALGRRRRGGRGRRGRRGRRAGRRDRGRPGARRTRPRARPAPPTPRPTSCCAPASAPTSASCAPPRASGSCAARSTVPASATCSSPPSWHSCPPTASVRRRTDDRNHPSGYRPARPR